MVNILRNTNLKTSGNSLIYGAVVHIITLFMRRRRVSEREEGEGEGLGASGGES